MNTEFTFHLQVHMSKLKMTAEYTDTNKHARKTAARQKYMLAADYKISHLPHTWYDVQMGGMFYVLYSEHVCFYATSEPLYMPSVL